MRNLVLLRGVAGCGKSTFIRENNLSPYTICADDIRLLIQAPVLTTDGGYAISQNNDKRVWEFIMQLVETRMERGEFIIIDATHSRGTQINNYRKLAERYRYRVFVVDFSAVPLEQAIQWNEQRLYDPEKSYKYVPVDVIETMHARITTQPAPGWVKVIKPEAWAETFSYQPKDYGQYKRIHHIGDLHGCYTVLQEYLDSYSDGVFKDDELYIFIGDYVDRGIENRELVEFLMAQRDKSNVYFLAGNHEVWLDMYAREEYDGIKSGEFNYNTAPQLMGVDKKQLREWTRRFGQLAYYTYPTRFGVMTMFVNHGGMPVLPSVYHATHELVHGVGKYEEAETVQTAFTNSTYDLMFTYQVHGHRNTNNQPITVPHTNCFNLCDTVEYGGNLRVLTLDHNGFDFHYIKNNVFRTKPQAEVTAMPNNILSVEQLVQELRQAKGVSEKRYDVMGNRNPAGHISCFNFTRNVFYNRGWTDMNELARSLYINTNDYSIAARAYPKWFRVNETEATKLAQLKKTIQFPAQVYIKENGFLGLVGYDTTMQRPLYATKGSTQGPYVEWFKAAFTDKQRAAVEEYVTNNPYTLIFECIDFAHDPHIVDAADDRAFNVLLDGVKRSVDYEKLSRDELIAFGNKSDLYVKARYRTLETWEHFMSLYDWVQEYAEGDMEGYVIEDAAGFCVKLKTEYYNFWKWMRSVRDTLKARRPLNMKQFDTVRSNQVVAWLKTLTAEELQLSIPELRNKYNNLHP